VTAVLRVERLVAAYDDIQVLREVSLEVRPGEAVGVIGPNGAGKTTLFKAICGLLRPRAGQISWEGVRLDGRPAHDVARRGVVYVPAERELFPQLTVADNLTLGAYAAPAGVGGRMARVYDLFPRLAARRPQRAETLSGGEQQMLAIGRAVMAKPRLMLLDEPSTGLAPRVVAAMYHQLTTLRKDGLTILLAEQQVPLALSFCDRIYVLENGRVVLSGPPQVLLGDPGLKRAYLGVEVPQ
jgi:branched-chain amino acid transport system ATP-binding protein